jgi:hypothetical protein
MSVLPTPAPGTGGDFTPIMAYKANQGRLYLRNRTQDAAGNWQAEEVEITQARPTFAVDFGRIEVGWCHFVAGAAPQWAMVPLGQAMPPMPPSPGNDDKGKALNYRQGFRVPVAGNAIGGVRELAGNSAAMINGINKLHSNYEAAPQAYQGKIPIVQMTDTLPVKTGQTTNFEPVFTIIDWVDRPDILGPRTVAAPGEPVMAAPVQPTPVQQQAAMTAPAMQAPPMQAPKTPPPAGMPF